MSELLSEDGAEKRADHNQEHEQPHREQRRVPREFDLIEERGSVNSLFHLFSPLMFVVDLRGVEPLTCGF